VTPLSTCRLGRHAIDADAVLKAIREVVMQIREKEPARLVR